MIEIESIAKHFDGKPVLRDISFRFEKNKVNMVIGGSGAGKSVLLKCISGLITPDTGTVKYENTDFFNSPKSIKQRIRREMGMLFQNSALFDSKNVEENIRFPLDLLSTMGNDEKLDRVNYCLHRVGLDNLNKKIPSEISGGMKKRVGIARAIALNSLKYLFCDEPNSGLDPKTAHRIDELILDITQEMSLTTVVISHDLNSVASIGDHILFLHEGIKEWAGSKKNMHHTDSSALQEFLSFGYFQTAIKKDIQKQ